MAITGGWTASSPGKTMLGVFDGEDTTGSSKQNVGTGGLASGGGLKMTGICAASAIVDRRLSLSSLGPRESGRAGIISSTGTSIEMAGAGSGAARIGRGDAARRISCGGGATACIVDACE